MTSLNTAFSDLAATPRMPALFVGHGNPMNAITDNEISQTWRRIGNELPVPAAILCVSAHWMTRGVTLVNVSEKPRTIHDFGGFPKKLFDQQYPAPGAPDIARATIDLVRQSHIDTDEEWGLDHGAWSVLIQMFPKADIPVFQLSLDLSRPPEEHYALAQELKALRERGVMIIGSGNVVHNLMAITNSPLPYDFTYEFDSIIAQALEKDDVKTIVEAPKLGKLAKLAHPTIEHFLPILYAAGVRDEQDKLSFFNNTFDMGSISMRSFMLS